MSKPILVIKYPPSYTEDVIYRTRYVLDNQDLSLDYHTFLIPNNVEEIDVRVFNGEYTEDDLTTIKSFINDLVQDYKSQQE